MRYSREDGCRAWLTYGQLRADILCELLDEFGCAEAIYDRFQREGSGVLQERIGEAPTALLKKQADPAVMHEMMLGMQRLNIGILGLDDPRYPDALRHIQAPPALLYYRGNPDCLMGKCITIIGTRKASSHGIEATRRISQELSAAGVTIVSGFAMGLDAAAHRGCLEGGSPTAAVLATGIDVDYPVGHVELKEEIVRKGGVLLSEYPLGSRAMPHVFAGRNRIMSGLSKAVIMMEAGLRSGCMITVNHALDQGREVFAYPGIPGTEWAEGAHALLRDGASFFTSAQDILTDLGWAEDMPVSNSAQQPQKTLPPLTDTQRRVYLLLGQGEMSFDQLAAESGMSASDISIALTMLQMLGLVKSLPGKSYSKV